MFTSNRILTLDIGASKLVLAEFGVTSTGVPQLVNYAIGRLDVGSEWEADTSAYIVSTIRDLLRESHIRPGPVAISLSGQAVFPRYVKLPPVARDKIAQMVRYEAEQNVPFPIDEVVWDYQLVPGAGDDELNVMLVAAKIENVKRLTDCVQAAGLEPELVDVAPMALYNVVRYNYPDLDGCTMVLDIGARSSNLVFVEPNRIFSRSIPVAGNAATQEIMKAFDIDVAEAEQLKHEHAFVALGGVTAGPENRVKDRVSRVVRGVVTRLHAEVSRSINFYRGQQGGQPPSRVFLTGGSSVMPHMDTFFREKLKVPVDVLNPFLQVPVSAAIDQERIAADIVRLGEVTGLALHRALSCPVEINLLPPDLVARKTLRRRQPFFALSALGVVLIMLCWWFYFMRRRDVLQVRVTKVEERIGGLAVRADGLNKARQARLAVQQGADRVAGVVRLRTRWLEILDAVQSAMHEGMWITAIEPGLAEGRVAWLDISWRAFRDRFVDGADGTATEALTARLRAMPCFSAETTITREPPVSLRDFDRAFTIRVHLAEPIDLGDTARALTAPEAARAAAPGDPGPAVRRRAR